MGGGRYKRWEINWKIHLGMRERAKEDVEEGHIKKDVEDIEEDVGKLV